MQIKQIYLKIIIFSIILFFTNITQKSVSQENTTYSTALLDNQDIQLQIGHAINDMYNFKFTKADAAFIKLSQDYPEHPLASFLLALSYWWKMMPNIEQINYDEQMTIYINETITLAEKMYEANPKNAEGLFFLSAGYGMKARLLTFRERYRKASGAARKFLKYFKESKGLNQLSPEFIFGDGLFNFYAPWLKENYPLSKPLLVFMPKGNKELGLQQLQQAAYNAFYTRTEAQFFLMEIYNFQEPNREAAYSVAYYLHNTFPDNPYFHRSYVEIMFGKALFKEVEKESKEILRKIEEGYTGYEAFTGRYAAYFLGYIYWKRYYNAELAKKYFELSIKYSEQVNVQEYGYYHGTLYYLAKIAHKEERITVAKLYYAKLLENIGRDNQFYKEAKDYMKKYRKF